jgi:iron complex outermembrane receptor protein
VRTPSIEENSVVFNVPISLSGDFLQIAGNDDLDPEELWAYELGWRHQPTDEVAFDVAAFFNDYDEMLTQEDGTPFMQGGNTFYPVVFENMGRSQAYGVEAAVDWTPLPSWRLRSGYGFLRQINEADTGSTDPGFDDEDDFAPRHMLNVRSYVDLGDDWELDLGAYWVDVAGGTDTPAYLRTDVRLGYSPCDDWRFSIGVQNAFDRTHPEEAAYGAQVRRNFWLGLSWSH